MLQNADKIFIEQHDHYIKQTYRNRCTVLGANGLIDLSIPVVKQHGKKICMRDVRIDYDTNWMHNHWRSITSAYASAPFFEFASEYFRPHFQGKRNHFLIDLNTKLLESAVEALGITLNIGFTNTFEPLFEADPRETIHPKRVFESETYQLDHIAYHQVFEDRFGFQPNPSILDLIFNMGQDAPIILKKMLKKKPGKHHLGTHPGHPDS